MQLPNLQFIKNIPVWGTRLFEAFDAVQQQTTHIETQGNLNATGDPPVPPPPDALNVTNGPSGEYQIAITHNGEFNRGTTFHVQWDTSRNFSNPHNIDLGASRNDSSLNLPGQTAYFRASAASPSGANSTWTYHGSQNAPRPVVGGVRGVRAPGMGSGTSAPGDQSGGPGLIQSRNSKSGYNWKLQQRTAGAGFGASAQGSPAGIGASSGGSGGGGGGGGITLSETLIAAAETLTSIAGTGNAITGVTNPAYSVRVPGFVIRYFPIHANSAATTINDNAIGVVSVLDNAGNALVGGEFVIGKPSFLTWDGIAYRLLAILAPISATVLASDSHGVPSVAPLASGSIWQGNGSNLPVAVAVPANATVAATNASSVIIAAALASGSVWQGNGANLPVAVAPASLLIALGVNINAGQTTVAGSTSGSAIFSEPLFGSSFKIAVIYATALLGTASYTFPTAFVDTPAIIAASAGLAGIVTTLSSSTVTVTGTTTTGFVFLIGY